MAAESIEDRYARAILSPRSDTVEVADGDILCEVYSAGIRVMPDTNHEAAYKYQDGTPVFDDCPGPHTVIRVVER